MNIGNKIIKLRKKERMSQEILASKLDVSRNTISNWELNITKPDILQMKKISKLFNISIDELLDNDIGNVIENRLRNTEKNIINSNKIGMIICITLYFLILSFLVIVWIYFGNKKDFTDGYSPVYLCTINDDDDSSKYGLYKGNYYIYINKDFDSLTYSIFVEYTNDDIVYDSLNDDTKYGMEFYDKIFLNTSSWMDAVDMYYDIKNRFLSDGAVCRDGIVFE